MPAISILVDGEPIATANTEGLSVLSAHVQGARSDEAFASVDLHGTTLEQSTFLIWIGSLTLQPGQQVEVRFMEVGETAPPGKTIEELFPDEPGDEEPDDETSEASAFEKIRAKPLHRAGYGLAFSSSDGVAFEGRTGEDDHAFALHVAWNMYRPDRAHLSLRAYTLDELESRAPLRDMVREYLQAPCTVNLRISA
ncbi:hypothetical protein ACQ859_25680 [Roseateles chitinivorans]|uniref:hypothetical protein n=1 Tax=Roseateles chitinivorans TaxID=2917965 RepID=UPI003D673720